MRRLLPYIAPRWRELTVALIVILHASGIGVLAPFPMKIVVDNVLADKPAPDWLASLADLVPGAGDTQALLILAVVATVLIFLVGTLIEMAGTLASTRLGQRLTFDLGADLFLHLQRLSLVFHSRRPVGDTIARVTGDTYGVAALVTGVMLPVVQSVITLIAMFVIMITLSPTLTLLALAVVPFQILAIRMFAGPMKDRSRARRDLEGRMMSVVHQTLTAVPAVQAYTREDIEHGRFRGYADKTVRAYMRETLAGTWFQLFAGLTTAIGTAAILYLGARQVLSGDASLGTILVFLAYLATLYGPLNQISYTASTYQQAAAEMDRVMELLETPVDVMDTPDSRHHTIRSRRDRRRVPRAGPERRAPTNHPHVVYKNVDFEYEDGVPVLRDVSFEAQPHETVAIVGPTGAGKTTLVNLLIRFFDPTSGRVVVDGEDLRNYRVRAIREQVAMVLQEPFIFPLTIAENIAYGRPHASREEIERAAQAANADTFIERLSNGYDSVVGERGATLSGGEKQRLSIARAFLKDAPILILDEPTSALDARTEAALLDALERLSHGRTTFIIAHRLSTIRNANRILVLDHGRLIEEGGHRQLIERDGLYASLYRQQMDVVMQGQHVDEVAEAAPEGTGA
jgi:ATP-binding cassette subfamily B protein